MGIDEEFLRKIDPLCQADMGTELMGPLLYSLIRSTRPRRLLEVGMGYTTPFMLKALAENAADAEHERRAMVEKTRVAMARLGNTQDGGQANRIFGDWFRGDPALGAPSFYQTKHAPKLHAIDLLNHPNTTAGRVKEAVDSLGLQSFVELHIGDFRGMSTKIASRAHPFDFVWFDCGGYPEYVDFLAEYWDFISEKGGVLILHLTLNDYAIGCIMRDLKLKQASNPDKLELLSLVEPHKATQGSFTMVRKLGSFRDPFCDTSSVLRDARHLLEIADAESK